MRQSQRQKDTEITRQRYNRIARMYDRMEGGVERIAFRKWRQLLWSRVQGSRILEVGVGTGRNIPYYPGGASVTAVDLSEGMLVRAQQLAARQGINVDLHRMDVQQLEFPDLSFDAVVATFVFCSVPDPVLGLREVARVTRTGGDLWLLEHMRVNHPLIGAILDLVNPLVVRVMGANVNRKTVENVRRAGLQIQEVRPLFGDLVQLIHAR